MRNLFFYGTLAHHPLLELILGRVLDTRHVTPATLEDHAAYWVKGQAHPVIATQVDAQAQGLLVTELSPQDVERLNFYEGGFEYDLRRIQVETADGPEMADVYSPTDTQERGAPWRLQDWVEGWADMTVQAAREAMSYFGQIDAAELTRRFPAIRKRAASVIRARTTGRKATWGSDLSRMDVVEEGADIPYSNFFAMQEYDVRFRKFSGEMSTVLDRASFIGFDVSIVLPYDPVRDCVLLVEQFRLGPFARGTQYPWMLEPVAGHVDVGETPEQAARRETIEEAGLNLHDLLPITEAYPSPGCSSEYYHIYLGLCDLQDANGGTAGLDSENEDIRSHILSYDELMQFVDSGEANVLPLVMAANWLARNRDRLRRGA